MKRYKEYRTEKKGSVLTYYDDSSLTANRTGLIVADMIASILSGSSVSVNSQTFTSADNQLAYQLRFNNAGKAVVRITVTFSGTDETKISDYHYTTIDNQSTSVGYV